MLRSMALGLGMLVLVSTTGGAAVPMLQSEATKAKDDAQKKKDGDKDKEKKPPKVRTPAEDSLRIVKRAEKARELPLFKSTAPVAFTLVANFDRLSKERDTLSKTRFDGTLIVADDQGVERRLPVKLRTRGHYRLLRRNCRFVNLLVIFPDSGLKGTPFQGQERLKLGAHCQSDGRYDQYTMKEYLAYRIFNQVTDRSFRARLSTGTYVDSASGKKLEEGRAALWIENEDDVAARAGARMSEIRGALFDDVDREQLDLVTLFEYAIGNTDFSLYALHNIRVAQTPEGVIYPYAYDFDFSGLVNTSYATPDPSLNIRSVRQRLYRGPCRKPEEFAPITARFLEKRDAILGVLAETPGLKGGEAQDVREWLDEFFRVVSDPRQLKREILERCVIKPGV